MPSILSLAKMELNGFGFCPLEAERQRKVLMAHLEELEQEAYELAGRCFSITSPDDVCKVLYRELRLPLNGEPDNIGKPLYKTKLQSGSSNKEVLLKLAKFHKLPQVVLEWRKINAAVTKVVFPMTRAAEDHPGLNMSRIYSVCQTFTATGRVSLHEPNIQNVPKDFDVIATPQLIGKALGNEKGWANRSALLTPYASLLAEPDIKESYSVSLRRAFVASEGCLIIAADYSQLELRILAHMSEDKLLCKLLGMANQDVLKAVASSWKKKSISKVTKEERQQAKQICYGILYGIGVKSLSEQLGVTEEEAFAFTKSFMATYPGVKKFIDFTVSECRKNGYISTICGRRRYLPNINASENTGRTGYARAAAERQAVNSTIQGSAADLVKKATIDIDLRLVKQFANASVPLRYRKTSDTSSSVEYLRKGAHFILQLHDELYYEVRSEDITQVAKIIRQCMENAMKLRVPTPVCVKIGPSWGELLEMSTA